MLKSVTSKFLSRLLALIILTAGSAVLAETPTRLTIIADEMTFSGTGSSFTADGNVLVRQGRTTVWSPRIEYSEDEGLHVYGPLYFSEGEEIIGIAEYADLSRDLREGILQGIRLLVDERLQIAANSASRTDHEFVSFEEIVVTTCETCNPDERPIWHFRARSMSGNPDSSRIHLRDVQFVFGSVPIFWLPWLTIPHFAIDRSSGILPPTVSFSNDNSIGVRLPFYLVTGDSSDLTLTPGLSGVGRSGLEYEFRNRFKSGFVDVQGSSQWSDPEEKFFEDKYQIRSGWVLENEFRFSLFHDSEAGSPDQRSLGIFANTSDLTVGRISRRRQGSMLSVTGANANPDTSSSAPSDTLNHLADARLQYDGFKGLSPIDVTLDLRAQRIGSNVQREELARAFFNLNLTHLAKADSGMTNTTSVMFGGVAHRDLSVSEGTSSYDASFVAANRIGWPLYRRSKGSTDMLEPVFLVVYAEEQLYDSYPLPNAPTEFDETNLFSIDRIGDPFVVEPGLRFYFGARMTRFTDNGAMSELIVGRVLRDSETTPFEMGSGMEERLSDYVAAMNIQIEDGLEFRQRVRANKSFALSRAETSVSYDHSGLELGLQYGWSRDSQKQIGTHGWKASSGYKFSPNWIGTVEIESDLNRIGERSTNVGLTYRQRCLTVTAEIGQDLASRSSLKKSTNYGLKLSLSGLTSSEAPGQRNCN